MTQSKLDAAMATWHAACTAWQAAHVEWTASDGKWKAACKEYEAAKKQWNDRAFDAWGLLSEQGRKELEAMIVGFRMASGVSPTECVPRKPRAKKAAQPPAEGKE